LLASSSPEAASHINIPEHDFEIVREGMRLGVTDGIGQAVNLPYVHVAVKTGTAQVGVNNQYENSWAIGFFPYEHPKYAFAVVLEKGPSTTTVGAAPAFGQFLMWMHDHEPQYLGLSTSTAPAL